jgi:hypothetical protein
MSNNIRTPFENPIANKSLTAHIDVISTVLDYLVNILPIELNKPPLSECLSDYSYINSQLVTSRHSKKLVSVIVALWPGASELFEDSPVP